MSEINWGAQGVNWGLFSPPSGGAGQGGNAFSDANELQLKRDQMSEQRRQFDASLGLRTRESDRQASQFNQQFGLQSNADARSGEAHKYKIAEEKEKLEDRHMQTFAGIHQLAQAAGDDPQKQAKLLDYLDSKGMDTKSFRTPDGWRFGMARMQRFVDNMNAQQADQAAKTDKTKSEANWHNAQADQIRTKQDDPMDQLMRAQVDDYMKKNGIVVAKPQPSGNPPAALSPSPNMPGPRLIPQSDPMEPSDPNLIQAQAPGAQPSPQPVQQTGDMVQIPGFPAPVPRQLAEMYALKAARDKNQPLADLINQSLNKVPKALQDDIGKKQMAAIDQAARLDGIRSKFKPEYQTYEEGFKQAGLNFMDSFDALRGKITPEHAQQMTDYAAFRQEAMANMNEYIKEVTGAAMGIQEEKRIRMAMPDPQKDGPTQFKTKLDNSVRIAKLALARNSLLQANGFSADVIRQSKEEIAQKYPLDAVPGMINKYADDLKLQLQKANPNVPEPQIDAEVKKRVKGLGI